MRLLAVLVSEDVVLVEFVSDEVVLDELVSVEVSEPDSDLQN